MPSFPYQHRHSFDPTDYWFPRSRGCFSIVSFSHKISKWIPQQEKLLHSSALQSSARLLLIEWHDRKTTPWSGESIVSWIKWMAMLIWERRHLKARIKTRWRKNSRRALNDLGLALGNIRSTWGCLIHIYIIMHYPLHVQTSNSSDISLNHLLTSLHLRKQLWISNDPRRILNFSTSLI